MEDCAYGIKSASFGKVFTIGETAVPLVWVTIPLIVDIIARKFPTWKYFGPGTGYIRGTSANRWISITCILLLIAMNLLVWIFSCVVLCEFNGVLKSVFKNTHEDDDDNAETDDDTVVTRTVGKDRKISREEADTIEYNGIGKSLIKFVCGGENESNRKRYTMPSEMLGFLLLNVASVLTST